MADCFGRSRTHPAVQRCAWACESAPSISIQDHLAERVACWSTTLDGRALVHPVLSSRCTCTAVGEPGCRRCGSDNAKRLGAWRIMPRTSLDGAGPNWECPESKEFRPGHLWGWRRSNSGANCFAGPSRRETAWHDAANKTL